MAKLDPDSLRSEPTDDIQARIPGERGDTEKFIAQIKGMIVGTEYEYAEGTLRGILETVQRTQIVTPNQRQAIERIADQPHRGTLRARGRRGY